MQEEQVRAIFTLAGIEITGLEKIENEYWPEAYTEQREANPWWNVMTPVGTIKLGWRKRVLNIDWTDTSVRAIVTKDSVTKDETHVHAWSMGKAVNYLTEVRRQIDHAAIEAQPE